MRRLLGLKPWLMGEDRYDVPIEGASSQADGHNEHETGPGRFLGAKNGCVTTAFRGRVASARSDGLGRSGE